VADRFRKFTGDIVYEWLTARKPLAIFPSVKQLGMPCSLPVFQVTRAFQVTPATAKPIIR
jgi:hypothetical protein